MNQDILVINGEEGEGGGQVLRSSLTLSTITKKPFKLINIRGKRKVPGLQKQHLTCVKSATQISGAEVEGAHLNSSEISYFPNKIKAGDYSYDLGGAGSTMLVAQTILPILAHAEETSKVTLLGGTHNDMAPPFDFVVRTLLPWTKKMGFDIQLKLHRHGFYPRGGGKISATVHPFKEGGNIIDIKGRGKLLQLKATILHSRQSNEIIQEEVKELSRLLEIPEDCIQVENISDSKGPGNVIFLEASYEQGSQMFTSFCNKKGSPKKWIKEIASDYHQVKSSSVLVEEYLCDQLLLYMALKKGGEFLTPEPLSLHTTTNIEIIEKFLPVRFTTTSTAEGTIIKAE